jgi:hypothetical protein
MTRHSPGAATDAGCSEVAPVAGEVLCGDGPGLDEGVAAAAPAPRLWRNGGSSKARVYFRSSRHNLMRNSPGTSAVSPLCPGFAKSGGEKVVFGDGPALNKGAAVGTPAPPLWRNGGSSKARVYFRSSRHNLMRNSPGMSAVSPSSPGFSNSATPGELS